jgi:RND family efflux transporter MFP subunit
MSEQRHNDLGIHVIEPDSAHDLLKRRHIIRRAKIIVFASLVLLALGAGRTVLSRVYNAGALEKGTAERAKQYVKVTQPGKGGGQNLVLPGTLQGYVQSPISARTSGYLRRWTKDIGSRVAKGELLAEIDAPEIDQQLSQGIAAREQAAQSLALARSSMERWEALRKRDAVSQQELDERRSGEAQAKANLAAADANVERLRQLEGFKRVTAPFAGVITRRSVDTGDLIDAGGGGGRTLFLLTQTDPLRIYVNVPQAYAQLIKPGQKVSVTQAEIRGKSFSGEVARTAASIDAATRSMQIEISLPNREGELLPGAYVQVSLPIQAGGLAMTMSTNTLMFRGEGMRVAVVDDAGRIKLRPVKVGRNYGESVEVIDGVGPNDRVVLNPSDSLADGDQVEVVVTPAKDEKSGKGDAAKSAAGAKDGAREKP